MNFLDSPELMIHRSPEFKAMLPPLCQPIPLDGTFMRQLQDTLDQLAKLTFSGNEEHHDKINAARAEILNIWVTFCLEHQIPAGISHGGVSYVSQDTGIIFQLMKTSIAHPRRKGLTIHAFSFGAFFVEEDGHVILLGEDAGAHFTMFNAEPSVDDSNVIQSYLEKHKDTELTVDHYLEIF